MKTSQRTATCGELTVSQVGKTVELKGWVHRIRSHGGIYFIDIRDRWGITQMVFDSDGRKELLKTVEKVKREYCIAVTGLIRPRPKEMVNRDMPTGEIEVVLESLKILNTCPALPFTVDLESDAKETLRLQYRYLDMRSKGMLNRLRIRHQSNRAIREYLNNQDFWEIETPTFIKSTPEGARDYLVPSRLHPGHFYALPQSPQLYKQILMVGGIDRYYQMPRCYRDEDSRGDRQPEFTQIDLEMSFVSREDVLKLSEAMMFHLLKDVLGHSPSLPFPRFTWKEAMETYGTDKPDLRFGLSFQDFSPFVQASRFEVFKKVLNDGGVVKCLVVPGAADSYSRKDIASLEEIAKSRGAKGLAWMKVGPEGLDGGVSKFFADQAEAIKTGLGVDPGALIFLIGDEWKVAHESLAAVRVQLARELKLIRPGDYQFCWVIDFPLFEKDEDTNNWNPAHHLFSMPQKPFLPNLEDDPGVVIGDLYDLVLNGNEVASGSVRIHDPQLQKRIFEIVGITQEEAEKRFGFFLKSLEYGAPPHAGIAFGFDRLIMIMAGMESIREVIAFPKNTTGVSPLDGSPSLVDEEQLAELSLKSIAKENQ